MWVGTGVPDSSVELEPTRSSSSWTAWDVAVVAAGVLVDVVAVASLCVAAEIVVVDA